MKTTNLLEGLKSDGFNDVQIVGKDVKVNIGFMAKKNWGKEDYATERACFEDLKFKVMNWASVHGTSCRREGGAMIVFGE